MRERANRCCVWAKRLRLRRCASGKVVWQWDNQDPFGNNVPNENPNGVGQFSFNLRFPGQYADRETNTNYNINRDYDASTGRYVESDPIGLLAGTNTYAYVGGNPLNYVDSMGLFLVYQNADGSAASAANMNAFNQATAYLSRDPAGDGGATRGIPRDQP